MTQANASNSKPKTTTPLLVRPGWWLILAILFGGLIAVVQWPHPKALQMAGGLAFASLSCLLMMAWSFGYGGRNRNDGLELLEKSITENTDGIMLSDTGGALVYSNPAFHRLLSFAADKNAARRVPSLNAVSEALDDENAEKVRRLVVAVGGGSTGNVEFSVRRGPGNIEWRRLTAVSAASGRGETGSVFWRVEDITSQRELDVVRRDEEEYVADLLDFLPVGFFSADGDGVLLNVNQTLARWLGVPPERLIGTPFADYVHELGGEGDLSLHDSEGRVFTVALEQSQKDADDGDVSYTRSIVLRDLLWGEVKKAQDATIDNGDEFQGTNQHHPQGKIGPEGSAGSGQWLFDDAPVGIVLLDLSGNVTDCNRAFLRLIGAHIDTVLSRPFVDFLAKEDRGDISTSLSKIVMGISRGGQLEVRLPAARERELSAALYTSRMVDADGEVMGLVLHLIDVTEQRNLEVQFSQSQKMQAVGQLAGGVAHDFNNLLTAMIGFSDLLLARHGPDDPSFSDIQQIKQNANRATNLVRQLLAFSRKQTLTLARLDVTDALNDLSNLLSRLIGERVVLTFDSGRELFPVQADRGQFDQVVINLTVNARDAMPGGGNVTLRTSNVTLDEEVQRGHDLMPIGRYVLIEVIDTGEGIPKENLDRIFEPFFSTKEVGAGTGLGLSTVYGIVHQGGGFIFVDSAPGEGTRFSIYLPEYEREDGEEVVPVDVASDGGRAASLTEPDLTGQGVVLLVEDEDAVRTFATRALRNKGYTVLEADNGEGALDAINSTDQKIDIIVSDVVMPGMDGNTLVSLVRQEFPNVKVILMSGYAEDVFRNEIGRDESLNFLGKPFTLKDLAGKVKEVLEA